MSTDTPEAFILMRSWSQRFACRSCSSNSFLYLGFEQVSELCSWVLSDEELPLHLPVAYNLQSNISMIFASAKFQSATSSSQRHLVWQQAQLLWSNDIFPKHTHHTHHIITWHVHPWHLAKTSCAEFAPMEPCTAPCVVARARWVRNVNHSNFFATHRGTSVEKRVPWATDDTSLGFLSYNL